MNGPEHYREAENCLRYMDGKGKDACAVLLGQAQAHATLALAAATALSPGSDMPVHDDPILAEWRQVAS